jgi:3-hydroxyisobutyrate dehydrogenase-like beta-hydroxyacid dehydrogenase
MKIGFIGLGIMGSRMAANLQKHGYSLVVFNRTRQSRAAAWSLQKIF